MKSFSWESLQPDWRTRARHLNTAVVSFNNGEIDPAVEQIHSSHRLSEFTWSKDDLRKALQHRSDLLRVIQESQRGALKHEPLWRTLFPDNYNGGSFDYLTVEERLTLGKALGRKTVIEYIKNAPLAELLCLDRSGRAEVLTNVANDAPYYQVRFRDLERAGILLSSTAYDGLRLLRAADPANFAKNLATLPPEIVFGFLAREEDNGDQDVLALLEEHHSATASAALHFVFKRLNAPSSLQSKARDIAWALGHSQEGAGSHFDLLKIERAEEKERRKDFERHFVQKAGIAKIHPKLILSALAIHRPGAPSWEALDALIRSLSGSAATELGRTWAGSKGATNQWHVTNYWLRLPQRSKELEALAAKALECLYESTDANKLVSDFDLLNCALVGMEILTQRSRPRVEQNRDTAQSKAIRALQGRGYGVPRFQVAVIHSLGLNPGTRDSDLAFASAVVESALTRPSPSTCFDTLASRVLADTNPGDARQLDEAALLIAGAIRSEGFLHTWPLWLPEDGELRGTLLRAFHDQMHLSARYIMNTCRQLDSALPLTNVFLESDCVSCQDIALQYLAAMNGSPIQKLAYAILNPPFDVRSIEKVAKEWLSAPQNNLSLRTLRKKMLHAIESRCPGLAAFSNSNYQWREWMEEEGFAANDGIIATWLKLPSSWSD